MSNTRPKVSLWGASAHATRPVCAPRLTQTPFYHQCGRNWRPRPVASRDLQGCRGGLPTRAVSGTPTRAPCPSMTVGAACAVRAVIFLFPSCAALACADGPLLYPYLPVSDFIYEIRREQPHLDHMQVRPFVVVWPCPAL